MQKGQIEIYLDMIWAHWYTVGTILRYIYLQYQVKEDLSFNVDICLVF